MKRLLGFRPGLRDLFTKRVRQEPPEPDESTPRSESAVQARVAEPFPYGIEEWIKCDDAVVDLCFIHGLTGNRNSTWTAPGQSEPWPKALLPGELPSLKVRIITYGYDAYVFQWGHASSNQLTDHGTNFLQKVTENREKNNATERPLIIIAHSLGGLVSKQAILRSRDSPESHLRNLYDKIHGIIFMGTPHTGSWMADWGKIPADVFGIFKSANTTLLRVLQTDDELLLSLNESFLHPLRNIREDPERRKQLNVICFFEELGYPKVEHIVSKSSATFASDSPISIHANHSAMTKFSTPRDDGFESVCGNLRRWTNELR